MSEKTVRRWVASGRLTADKRGRSFRIRASDLAAVAGHDDGRTADSRNGSASGPVLSANGAAPIPDRPHPDGAHWAALVDKLTQQNLEMAGRLGYLQAELAQAREQIKALQAPKEPIAPPPPVGAIFRPLPAEPEPPRRPWWRFW